MAQIGIGYNHNRIARIYLLGALGTVIEWYDFTIYGYLASVFAQLFFVNKSHWLSMVLVYSIFFISYLARPIGGIFYGYIGDYFGRRNALIFSIAMMSISMLIMIILPTWHTIGNVAPALLLIFRIIQSISVGGESAGALVYVLESVEHKRYGLFGSAIWVMGVSGTLLGSGMIALLTMVMPHQVLFSWGWRVAYLIGAILGIMLFIVRIWMPESTEFALNKQAILAAGEEEPEEPLWKEVLLNHKRVVMMVAFLAALPAAGFYFIFLYFPQYIHQYWHTKLSSGLDLNTLLLLIMIPAMIFFGYLSDLIGRRKMLVLAALGFLLLSYPLMGLVSVGTWGAIVICQLLFTFLETLYEGPFPSFMVELTTLKVRYTVIALGYNIGTALFGGAAPLIAVLLVHWRHNQLAPAFYLMAVALLSLTALFLSWRYQVKKV